MKKVVSIVLMALMICMLLTACGGETEILGCEGDYSLTSMSAMGVSLPGDGQISFTLKPGGKGSMEVEGTKGGIKWTLEGESLTLIVSGEEIKGTFKDNQLEFKDFQGSGMDCLFTLENMQTEQKTTENKVIPEEVGKWVISGGSYQEIDFTEEDVAEIGDAYIEFKEDGTGFMSVGESTDFTWKDKNITVTADGVTESAPYEIKEGELYLTLDEDTIIKFKK